MTGARIELDATDLGYTERQLGALADAGRDLQPAFESIGEYLVCETKERFREEKGPDGEPWAPLSESTKKRKKNQDRVLTLEGNLGGLIAFQASPIDLLVGSSGSCARHSPGTVRAGRHFGRCCIT